MHQTLPWGRVLNHEGEGFQRDTVDAKGQKIFFCPLYYPGELMKISEIFQSINGECCFNHQGSLCTFIRLQGCNLQCNFCDTKYAQTYAYGGIEMSISDIVKEIEELGNKNVTITGGEPLLQKEEVQILTNILDCVGYEVSIETNGSIPFYNEYPWDCSFVVDYKLPSSGMGHRMMDQTFLDLTVCDFIKFVCGNMNDFYYAMDVLERLDLECRMAFSPVFGVLDPVELYKWMNKEKLLKEKGAILSLQLHKMLRLK